VRFLFPILIVLIALSSCSSTKKSNVEQPHWAEVENDYLYLYKSPDTLSIVKAEISKGSTLYVTNEKDGFTEVYLANPSKVRSKEQSKYRFFVHHAKLQRRPSYKREKYSDLNLVEPKNDREYLSGEKGGCYYISRTGRKVYVERNLCGYQYEDKPKSNYSSPSYKSNKSKPSRTNSTSVQCSGTTQKGARCRNRTKSSSGRCHLH